MVDLLSGGGSGAISALSSSSLDASHESFTPGAGAVALSSSVLLASHSSLTSSALFESSAGAGDGDRGVATGAGLNGLDSGAGDAGAESLSLLRSVFFLREP